MAGEDGGPDPGAGPGRRWDVALSFAGVQRDYVGQVAAALKAQGVRCFYDADEQIDLWGKYLAEELPAIYGEQAAAAVVFVSAEYVARDWTRLERRAALNRAVRERQEYVLPARFDDTSLPGLLSDMVAVDLRGRDPQQFAAMIAAKLAALGIAAPPAGPAPDAVMPRPGTGPLAAGRLLAEVTDPSALEVHQPVQLEDAPTGLPELPAPVPVPLSRLARTLTGHANLVLGVAFSPDGRLLATASADQTARLWDPATGGCLRTLTGHTNEVWGVAFSPDGRLLATASSDKTARLWDPATGGCLCTLDHANKVLGVAFSPDGWLLATASHDRAAQLWDLATGEHMRTLAGQTTLVRVLARSFNYAWSCGVAFSPDGRLLATASRVVAKLWDPATGDCLRVFEHDFKRGVLGVAFSPDGRLLATTSSDKTARLWDLATGFCLLALGHTKEVSGVAFSPDGRLLATTCADMTARLWNWPGHVGYGAKATTERPVALAGLKTAGLPPLAVRVLFACRSVSKRVTSRKRA